MITLHEVKGRRNKTIASFSSPDMLMVKMGFTLDETRRLISVAAATEDGQIPPESELVTRRYFVTFDDDYLRRLGIATALDEYGTLETNEISEVIGIDPDNVVRLRKSAIEKMRQSGGLRAFAEIIADLAKIRNSNHNYEIIEKTEIKITFS